MANSPTKPLTAPLGTGIYPSYDALWHLEALGLDVAASVAKQATSAPKGWREASARAAAHGRTRIALIDTSVSSAHPNLRGVVNDDLAIDLTISSYRAQGTPKDATLAMVVQAIEAQVERFIKDGSQPKPNGNFGSHGTAMAGLIAGRPAVTTKYKAQHLRLDGQTDPLHPVLMPLPFAGVDPTAELVPVVIGSNPDPEQIVAAFKYAVGVKADLIVMASDLPNPLAHQEAIAPGPRDYSELELELDALRARVAPVSVSDLARKLWAYLSGEIPRISNDIPVIAAAGNVPHMVVFPANLAAPDNGIISVGAVRRDHHLAAYSPGRDAAQGVVALSFSGDDERFDRKAPRYDILRDGFGRDDEAPWLKPEAEDYDPQAVMAVETLISTDVPGRFGYNASPHSATRIDRAVKPSQVRPDIGPKSEAATLTAVLRKRDIEVYTDFSAQYCRFSGTSAASAVLGGLLSLGLSSGTLQPGFVPRLKKQLANRDKPVVTWADVVQAGQPVS